MPVDESPGASGPHQQITFFGSIKLGSESLGGSVPVAESPSASGPHQENQNYDVILLEMSKYGSGRERIFFL